MGLSTNIRAAREKRGLSQEQLAERLGLTQVAIVKYESGAYQPNATMAVALAETLGVTVEQLVKGKEETHNDDQ